MKYLLLALALSTTFAAQASYNQTDCSNGQGTIQWGEGHDNNDITFRVQNDETGEETTRIFEKDQVIIKLTKEKIIAEDTVEFECGATYHTWTAAKATIKPTKEITEEFKALFPTGKTSDLVICHDRIDGDDPECEQK